MSTPGKQKFYPTSKKFWRYVVLTFICISIFIPSLSQAQLAVKIPTTDIKINSIQNIAGKVWIGTMKGAYRVDGNGATRIPETKDITYNIQEIRGKIWIGTNGGVYQVSGDKTKIVLDKNIYVKDIKEIGEQVWINTNKSLYRVEEDEAKVVLHKNISVKNIMEIDGKIWISTNNAVYRMEGNQANQILETNKTIQNVEKIGGDIWIWTYENAYRVEGNKAKLILKTNIYNIKKIKEIGGRIWIWTKKGVYRVDGDVANQILDPKLSIDYFQGAGKKVWIGTNQGVYRVSGDETKMVLGKNIFVKDIEEIAGEVWIGTNQGLFRMKEDEPEQILDKQIYVLKIKEIGGKIWIATNKSLYRVEGDQAKIALNKSIFLKNIKMIGESFWIGHKKEIYRVEGNEAKLFLKTNNSFKRFEKIAGKTWILTYDSVYRVEGDEAKPILETEMFSKIYIKEINGTVWIKANAAIYRVGDDKVKRISDKGISVKSFQEIAGKVWVWTDKGAYRVDENSSISVTPSFKKTWWGDLLNKLQLQDFKMLIPPVSLKATYFDSKQGKDPYGENFPRDFKVIAEVDENIFKEKINTKKFQPPESYLRVDFPSGFQTLHYQVKDQWNNTFQGSHEVLIAPGPALLPIIYFILWLIVLILAPFNKWCNDLIMNPLVRKIGSFWFIPTLISVSPHIRRYLLIRYLKSLQKDKNFSKWEKDFVYPSASFHGETFGDKIRKERKIFLAGKSGVGKTVFFQYLTHYFANSSNSKKILEKSIPVFLPLESFTQPDLETMIQDQLINYGRFSDKSLISWFLLQGGFLILIDGLNEVDEKRRKLVLEFLNKSWKANYICINSQIKYKEFKSMEDEELNPLSPDTVDDFIRRKIESDANGDLSAGDKKVQEVLERFPKEAKELFTNPQELVFAIEIAESGASVPTSKDKLYEKTLEPVIQEWNEENASYPGMLYERSYEMLASNQTSFVRDENPLPEEIRDRLLEKKFLRLVSGQYLFKHDLVRAYLAVQYFLPRWKELLKNNETVIRSDWKSMLELTILGLKDKENFSDEIKDLIFLVLDSNRELAKDLFRWLKDSNPEICTDWEHDFHTKLGAAEVAAN
jgi:ligand-binding sensor domain-containing protein